MIGERKEGASTYGLVISLTVGQPFLLIVSATFEWFLTVRTHKVLGGGGGGGGGRGDGGRKVREDTKYTMSSMYHTL